MPTVQDNPLVSILLPVYNCSDHLPVCLKSLLTQTYNQIEIIAIDDHSLDDSHAILRSFRKLDKRLRIARNIKHYGLATTLNRALAKRKGKLIAFMNPKDESKKDRIATQLTYLLSHPKTAVVGTQCLFLNEHKRRIGKSAYPISSAAIVKSLTNDMALTFESALINPYTLPKDILRFDNHVYPFLFTNLFSQILQFGTIENLSQYLYARVIKQQSRRLHFRESLLPSLRAWVKSALTSEFHPPLRSVIFPLIKTP